MTDMEVPTRVREHRERIVLRLREVLVRFVQAALGPPLLPVAFYGIWIVISLYGYLAH